MNILKINLKNNKLTDSIIFEVMNENLKKITNIRNLTINLNGNCLTDENFIKICENLHDLKNLSIFKFFGKRNYL